MFESAEIGHVIDKATWKSTVPQLRTALLDAQYDLEEQGKFPVIIPVIIPVSRQDAAGKGSGIRRVAMAMDARQYQIVPIAAPTEEERAQPYLWRFWRHVPRLGRVTILDRSWYGRVLVERIEGFCSEADWLCAR